MFEAPMGQRLTCQLVHQPSSWIKGFHHDDGQAVWRSAHQERHSSTDGHKLRCYRCEIFGHISRDCATPWTGKHEKQVKRDSWPYAPPKGLSVTVDAAIGDSGGRSEHWAAHRHKQRHTHTQTLAQLHLCYWLMMRKHWYQQCLRSCVLEASLI